MAEPLSRFPGGTAYLDAVPLVAYLDTQHRFYPSCRDFLTRASDPRSSIALTTASLTLDQVAYALLQELVSRPPFSVSRDRSPYLAHHPVAVQELARQVGPPLTALAHLVALEAVQAEDVVTVSSLMQSYGLLPRDAIHVAVAQRLGIEAIVSDDDAFERVPGIRLFKPEV